MTATYPDYGPLIFKVRGKFMKSESKFSSGDLGDVFDDVDDEEEEEEEEELPILQIKNVNNSPQSLGVATPPPTPFWFGYVHR